MMSDFKTRSQRYAADVLTRVKALEAATKKGDKLRTQYGSMAHKLPVLIRTVGLAQALTFVEARGQEGAKQLLRDLELVLGTKNEELQKEVYGASLTNYMKLTQDALYALLWYKRFAQSVLDIDPTEDAGDRD